MTHLGTPLCTGATVYTGKWRYFVANSDNI